MGGTSSTLNTGSTSKVVPVNNLASNVKPVGQVAEKVKPCCVCKEEKSARDECMLFSKSPDPQADCRDFITRYKTCMKGHGFDV